MKEINSIVGLRLFVTVGRLLTNSNRQWEYLLPGSKIDRSVDQKFFVDPGGDSGPNSVVNGQSSGVSTH